MKKKLALTLAIIMVFGSALTGCGKKTDKDGTQSQTAPVVDDDYVEEKPLDNALIYELPIPPETGTLPLEEESFEEQGLSFQVPPGVTAEKSDDSILFSDNGGDWTLSFTPFTQGGFYERRAAADHGLGESRIYREADRCDTEIKGFSAFVSAANTTATGRSAREDDRIPEYNIVIDYGSEYVGKWAGVQITLRPTKYDETTNIYEYLYLRHVRSLLNGFEPIKSYGEKLSAGGITVTLPERWSPKADNDSGTLTAQIVNGKQRGGLLITSALAHDSSAFARTRSSDAETFTKDYGSTRFTGFFRSTKSATIDENGEKQKTETIIAELYSEMGDGRVVRTAVSLRGADSKTLNEFLDSEVFADTMASLTADPSGYSSTSASAEGFSCTGDGYISSYDGGLSNVTIPSEIAGITITGIADGAFKGSKVTSVTIPAGVTEIGSKAFSGCKSLTQLNLPDGLLFIDSSAFYGCKNLGDVTLPSTVCYVGSEAFSESGTGAFGCLGSPAFDSKALCYSGFKSIDISGGDLSAAYVMNGCGAKSIVLGEGVEKLGRDCMSGCTELSSVTLPHGLKKLGKYCMASDPNLHDIKIPERLELIPEGCFSDTRLDTLILPENITGMEHYAVTSAGYLAIMNPEIKLAMEAFNVERVYLSGVHLSQEVPRGLEYQYVALQVYLAMDTLPKESNNMDDFLNGIGFGEIAWIGTDPAFLPADNKLYKVGEDYDIIGCSESSDCLYIPHFSYTEEENRQIYNLNKKVFTSSPYKEIYVNSNLESAPANVFADSAQLTDLWFSGAVLYQMSIEGFKAGCFYGLPENITVHLPARIEEADRAELEEKLHNKGIPASAVFDYYTL